MSAAFTNAPDPDSIPAGWPPPGQLPPAAQAHAMLRAATPDRLVLDVETVATVLFVSPFTPREWRQMGPTHMGRYVAGLATDSRFRIPELVALVAVTEHVAGGAGQRLTAARRFARRVLAALSN